LGWGRKGPDWERGSVACARVIQKKGRNKKSTQVYWKGRRKGITTANPAEGEKGDKSYLLHPQNHRRERIQGDIGIGTME